MKKYRLRIGLDVDDTLYECNEYALRLLRQKYGDLPELDINHIHGWGKLGNLADERLRYFGDPEFVRTQPIYPGARQFINDLMQIADVFFITAVPPACMSARAERLRADFGDVPESNIIIGTRKDIMNLDILLDDAPHNIFSSPATYPVLMRRPWNDHLSGLISVNTYSAFLQLVHIIGNSFAEKTPDLTHGGVLCLVGPTGTGKTDIARALVQDPRFFKPVTTTTRPRQPHEPHSAYRFVSKEQFLLEKQQDRFIETTVYGSHYFGTTLSAFEPVIGEGKIAVTPIDICGALTLKNLYASKVQIVFTTAEKQVIFRNILQRNTTDDDKVHRLMSIDYEMRNAELCDFAVHIDDGLDACLDVIYRKLRLKRPE